MGLINYSNIQDGVDAVNAESLNTPFNAIYDDHNGNITNENISASAAIEATKIQPIPAKSRLTFSGASATKNAVQVIPNATETDVVFETEAYDTDTYHDTGSNTGRLTVPATGYYHINAYVEFASWASGATGSRLIVVLKKNGTAVIDMFDANFWSAAEPALSLGHDLFLTAADYITIAVYQGTASSRNLTAASKLQIHCLGVAP